MTLIILPVHNEEKTISQTIKGLIEWCNGEKLDYEILVIDDHSTDGTRGEIFKALSQKVRAFPNWFDAGKGSALKTGYVLSLTLYSLYNYDNIIFMDGDGQIEPKEIKTFLNLMTLYSADAVIGNKRHDYSNAGYPCIRQIVSKGYNFLIRVLFGISLKDTQCGIKLFKKRALDAVIDRVNSKRYAFDLELLVALKEKRLRIVDAPVNLKNQVNEGSVSIKSIVNTFIDTMAIFLKQKTGQYK